MFILIIILSILAVILLATTLFLANEFKKRFRFMASFISSSRQMVEWYWPGGRKEGMKNIVLRGQQPFAALVGFRLTVPGLGSGYDYYGYVQSNSKGLAVISTYLGRIGFFG